MIQNINLLKNMKKFLHKCLKNVDKQEMMKDLIFLHV